LPGPAPLFPFGRNPPTHAPHVSARTKLLLSMACMFRMFFFFCFFIAGLFSLSAAGDGRRFMIWLQFRYKSKVSCAYIIRPRWGHWIRSNQAPGESIIVIKAKQSRPSTIINYQLAWHGQLFWWHFNAIIWFSLKFSIHTHKFHLHHIYLLVNWTHRYIVLVLHYITH